MVTRHDEREEVYVSLTAESKQIPHGMLWYQTIANLDETIAIMITLSFGTYTEDPRRSRAVQTSRSPQCPQSDPGDVVDISKRQHSYSKFICTQHYS